MNVVANVSSLSEKIEVPEEDLHPTGGDKLQLTGVSDKQQDKLIDTWMSSHIEGKKI